MNPLLEQFLIETREALAAIDALLLELEVAPGDSARLGALFRHVHTLKGNCGLFDFPEMLRVLHAAEDLMDAVRGGRLAFSAALADCLLAAMDFVGTLCQCAEQEVAADAGQVAQALTLASRLQALRGGGAVAQAEDRADTGGASDKRADAAATAALAVLLAAIPEAERMRATLAQLGGQALTLLVYQPDPDCFFQGDDPLHRAIGTPGLLWGAIKPPAAWPDLADFDPFRCQLQFHVLSGADADALDDHYRYVPEQRTLYRLLPCALVLPDGVGGVGGVDGAEGAGGAGDAGTGTSAAASPQATAFAASAMALLAAGARDGLYAACDQALPAAPAPLAAALRWLQLLLDGDAGDAALAVLIGAIASGAPPQWHCLAAPAAVAVDAGVLEQVLATQRSILALPDEGEWLAGRIAAVATTLAACLRASGRDAEQEALAAATAAARALPSAAPLAAWLAAAFGPAPGPAGAAPTAATAIAPVADITMRADDRGGGSVRVEHAKVDRLMNLIGEMVVAKNALPYLAARADNEFGVTPLAREIGAQYGVINRIVEEMQDAIMQVRMMPVSFVLQRFPRLVRDLAQRLGKQVSLQLSGQETAADKNIVEALGDPLLHIVRNSLDHGFEDSATRIAAGKPAQGLLRIEAHQDNDRVIITISDDGRGIDAQAIRRKAIDKGLIDALEADRMSDQDAVNLVFAAGFSTAEVVSDLSGRGVGMDVVRSAIEALQGSLALESRVGHGTRITLSLPLSMAVSQVLTIETDGQLFGVPISAVVETVRVPRARVRHLKERMTTLLRGRVLPLVPINAALGLAAAPRANADDELAVLVLRHGDGVAGVLVDRFDRTGAIVMKPLAGILGGLPLYAGSALMGDGSVLMVLNPLELF